MEVERPLHDTNTNEGRFTQQFSCSSTVSLSTNTLNKTDYFLADFHNLIAAQSLPAPEPQPGTSRASAHVLKQFDHLIQQNNTSSSEKHVQQDDRIRYLQSLNYN